MANNTFTGASDRDNWQREPYGVGLGQSFANYSDELRNTLTMVRREYTKNPSYPPVTEEDLRKLTQLEGASDLKKSQFRVPDVTDASLFGNDVFNPYAGFCVDDDIHLGDFVSESTVNGEHFYGMGRVYEEIYNSTQQVVYFQMGIPKYRNLGDLLSNGVDDQLSELNETGSVSLFKIMSTWTGKAFKLAIELPWLPFEWAWKAINFDWKSTKVTDFFYFREQMLVYYKYVNSLLAPLAVNLGLWREGLGNVATDQDVNGDISPEELPAILRNGPDIYTILQARSDRFGGVKMVSLEEAIEKTANDSDTSDNESEVGQSVEAIENKEEREKKRSGIMKWFLKMWEGAKSSALDANKFVSFRIEKGSDNASEQFSNSLRESSLATRLNQSVAAKRDRNLSAGQASGGLYAWARQTAGWLKSWKDTLTSFSNGGDTMAAIENFVNQWSTGNGYYDLPQEWSGANFSRSISLTFRLRSKTGGDNVSVFTNIFIPLTCLLAMALPRASGNNTYTSPFLVRCWCRGMFAIPAGYVTSLSVSRGDAEYGWSRLRLPTVVNVSMSITDLSPILFIGMLGNGGWLNSIFQNNSKLQEYISTLSGLGLKQRYYYMTQVRRNIAAMMLNIKNNNIFASPTLLGMRLGDTWVGRLAGSFMTLSRMRVNNN